MQNNHILMTQKGYEDLSRKLAQLEKELERLLLYKGKEAIGAGDHWHDNPTLYLTEMQERALLRQIADLRDRLSKAQIVKPAEDSNVVDVGLSVVLQFEDGSIECFELLGHENGNPSRGTVSLLSPLGKAILGARVGEVREYQVGSDIHKVVVLKISGPSEEKLASSDE